MTIYKREVESKIEDIVGTFGLEPELVKKSIDLYRLACSMPVIMTTRIRDLSMAVSCVFIISRLHSKKKISQEHFYYGNQVSSTTLRKTYMLICDAADIPRSKIVGRYADKK